MGRARRPRAQLRPPSGTVTGTSFAVWAPSAQGVRVTGDFDGWSGWAHPMRALGSAGVWELFVPNVGAGTRYKFRVLGQDGRWREKADPLAFRTEVPPATASIVDESTHVWGDAAWLAARAQRHAHAEPMSVYEVHLGSWKLGSRLPRAGRRDGRYLDETGFTHIELLPVAEHPFGGSWGYQVTSYYAPTSRFGTPDDFRYFVDHLHQHGYGVIVDWVPAHFPRDEFALARFDGTPLYEHADPRRGEQPDWGTLVFDFGRREVRNFLVANALYWLDEFHIDGLRVDAVASMLYLDYSRPEGQWLPNVYGGRENLDAVAFLQEMNATVYRAPPRRGDRSPRSRRPGRGSPARPTWAGSASGSSGTWGGCTTRSTTSADPVYRTYHHNQMTFSLMYAFSENFVLPISHDEVVHGKGSLWTRMPGDAWNKAAGLRALLAYMWAHPGKQLLFQGGEFGQEREWSESRSLDWHLLDEPLHAGIKALVGDLNRAYRSLPALWTMDVTPDGFSWIDANDASGNVLSFLRNGVDADGQPVVMACVANFSGDAQAGLPGGAAVRRALAGGAQHRRAVLRRLRGGQPRRGRGRADGCGTAGRRRRCCSCRRPGVLWLAPEPSAGAVRTRSTGRAPAAAEATVAAPPTGTDPRRRPRCSPPPSHRRTSRRPPSRRLAGWRPDRCGTRRTRLPRPARSRRQRGAGHRRRVIDAAPTTSPPTRSRRRAGRPGHPREPVARPNGTVTRPRPPTRPDRGLASGPTDMDDRGADDSSATQ